MSNDIVKKDPASIDSFAGWEDGVEGGDRPEGAGLIQGTLIKFTNEGEWVTRDGDPLPADLELTAVDVLRVVQKWQDQQPVETIILEAHQKFPDIEKMNAETPQEEWVEGPDGQMRGPWQAQHVLRLLDLKTMDKYTFPTGTMGGRIAIRDLRDKIMWMRRVRGPNVYPNIKFARVWMNTRFGGRWRPHFQIDPDNWVRLGGGEGGQAEALPPPASPLPPATSKEQLDEFAKPADKPAQPTTSRSELPLVQKEPPLTLAEELDDEVPTFETESTNETANEPPKAPSPRPTARRDLKPKSSPAKTAARSTARKRLSNLDAG
jgi:hypothetical protein